MIPESVITMPGITDHDPGIGDHVKSESVITIVRNTQLNEQLIEGVGQGSVALENERLRGDLEWVRINAAEELARWDL